MSKVPLNSVISDLFLDFLDPSFGHMHFLFPRCDRGVMLSISEVRFLNVPRVQTQFGKDGHSVRWKVL